MSWKFNPFTGTFDLDGDGTFQGELASAPSDPETGWTYINTGDNNLYVWGGAQWWILQAVTPSGGAVSYKMLMENSENFTFEDGDIGRLE